jgi:hypothetical protein
LQELYASTMMATLMAYRTFLSPTAYRPNMPLLLVLLHATYVAFDQKYDDPQDMPASGGRRLK